MIEIATKWHRVSEELPERSCKVFAIVPFEIRTTIKKSAEAAEAAPTE